MKNEAELVKKMVQLIKDRYPSAWVFKVVGNPYQSSGVPDVLLCINGQLAAIEAKHQKPGESADHAFGRTSEIQKATLVNLSRAGSVSAVAISVFGAIAAADSAAMRVSRSDSTINVAHEDVKYF